MYQNNNDNSSDSTNNISEQYVTNNNDNFVDNSNSDEHVNSNNNDSNNNDSESSVSDTSQQLQYALDYAIYVTSTSSQENEDEFDNDIIEVKDEEKEPTIEWCGHYNRGCDLLYSCCNKYFGCRFCHNDAMTDYKLDRKLIHECDRKLVSIVKCRYCFNEQEFTDKCTKCASVFGNYCCNICKLLDLDLKGQFHCDDCGICRQNGRENFFHCNQCGTCVSKNIDGSSHKCAIKLDGNCPVCCMSFINSTIQPIPLKCGHWMCITCLKEYTKHSANCPLCLKSLIDNKPHIAYLDQQIEATSMPDEFKDTMIDILCNDCEKKNSVKLHFYGLKCPKCGCYNTKRI